jgi:hypothetical protein
MPFAGNQCRLGSKKRAGVSTQGTNKLINTVPGFTGDTEVRIK